MKMKKFVISLLILSMSGVSIVKPVSIGFADASSIEAKDLFDGNYFQAEYKTLYVSNTAIFNSLKVRGIDISNILTEEECQEALNNEDDEFGSCAGGIFVTRYRNHKEIGYTVKMGSALTKLWKYGGKEIVRYTFQSINTCIKRKMIVHDFPVNPNLWNLDLQSLDDSSGYIWYLGTAPWRIISRLEIDKMR